MIDRQEIRKVSMFSRLPEETMDRLAAVLESRLFDQGEVLFHKGQAGDEMYLILEGSVAIYEPSQDTPGKERPLRIFRAGESLGEMALIDRQPRTLSARALQTSRVLALTGEHFRPLLQDHALALSVMAGLNDRIRYTTDFLGEVRQWIGRVATGQYETAQFFSDMQEWVRQLAEGEYQPAAEMSPARYRDQAIATLAAEFARMAAQVRDREQALREEIAQLKIEIDQTKRKRQVAEITESDFFQDIKSRAEELRRKRE